MQYQLNKYFLCVAVCILTVVLLKAQNLIVNGNFDIYLRCPKSYNHYRSNIRELLPGWNTVNKSTPDFFHRCSQNTDVGVPQNFAGSIEPHEGDGYIGLILRADKETYPYSPAYSEHITGTLEFPLEKGKTYCLKMYYSLAQNSGITTNSTGVYFSTEKPEFSENDNIYPFQPQIIMHHDSVLNSSAGWHLLSASYTAQGGEKFITIGNYVSTAKSLAIPHKPEVLNDTRFFAYYYVDNVSLVEVKDVECPFQTPFVSTIEKVSELNHPNDPDTPVFEAGNIYTLKNVYFDFEKAQLRPESYDELNLLIVFLKENMNIHIKISGHTDNMGRDSFNKLLSEARAKAVFEYLYEGGISIHRMNYSGMGSKVTVADNDTEYGRQQNRRVEIEFYIPQK